MPSPSLIAVVDDDESFRTGLVSFVRSLGYAGIGFSSAEDFLNSDIDFAVDCLVSDVHMTGMSGFELAQHIGRLHKSTSVILVTGRSEPALRTKARESGATCFLQKPFDPQVMTECLARAVGD